MINIFDESSLIILLLIGIHLTNIYICKRNYHINFNSILSLSILQILLSFVLFFITNEKKSFLWNIFYVDKNINLSLFFDKCRGVYLLLTNLLLLILLIYLKKFLQLFDKNNLKKIILYILSFFFILNLLIVSANLITSILIITITTLLSNSYFNARFKNENIKINNSLNIIYYLQHVLMFFILIILIKYFDSNSFEKNDINILSLKLKMQYLLYSLIYIILLLFALITLYKFYFIINLSITDELFFILSNLLPSLVLFTQLIFYICDFNFLPISLTNNNIFINLFITFNLLFFGSIMVYSKFKKNLLSLISVYSLFYLIFSFFINNTFSTKYIFITTVGYFINIISLFMMMLPFNTLQNKIHTQSIYGIFFLMPKSTIFLIIALLNLIGLSPSLNLISNYQIIKIITNKPSIIPFMNISIYYIFILGFLVFFFKIIFKKTFIERNKDEINLINKFENELHLVYSRIAIIVLSVIFFLFRKFLII